jgi:hypothetical protein
MLVAGPHRHGLQDQDQQGQPHRQLRKKIMKRDGEREVEPMNRQSVHISPSSRIRSMRDFARA